MVPAQPRAGGRIAPVNASFLHSINVGRPRSTTGTRDERTAIRKAAAQGPVLATRLGLTGDQVGNPDVHGGPDMAVYAFAREDLDRWAEQLAREVPDGQFGENITTYGIDVNAALVGERWRIGGAVFEVAKVRIPCTTFQRWMGESGYDSTAWVKRFALDGRPGPYLRVLEEGEIRVDDAIEVVHRPDHGISVSDMFRALTTERHRMPELLAIDGLAESVRRQIATQFGETRCADVNP